MFVFGARDGNISHEAISKDTPPEGTRESPQTTFTGSDPRQILSLLRLPVPSRREKESLMAPRKGRTTRKRIIALRTALYTSDSSLLQPTPA